MSDNATVPSQESVTIVSDEAASQAQEVVVQQGDVPKRKKVFTRADIKKTIDFKVHLPRLYEDYEPWGFKLRLKLSKDAEERRQEYLSLAPVKQTAQASQHALEEVCDLLSELPTGFSDLVYDGQSAGSSWKGYVESATGEAKDLLLAITEGADNLYWASISPREFRTEV